MTANQLIVGLNKNYPEAGLASNWDTRKSRPRTNDTPYIDTRDTLARHMGMVISKVAEGCTVAPEDLPMLVAEALRCDAVLLLKIAQSLTPSQDSNVSGGSDGRGDDYGSSGSRTWFNRSAVAYVAETVSYPNQLELPMELPPHDTKWLRDIDKDWNGGCAYDRLASSVETWHKHTIRNDGSVEVTLKTGKRVRVCPVV